MQSLKTLYGQERKDHIAEQQAQAELMLSKMTMKLSRRLSIIEVYDLMIAAIEARARCGAADIRRKASAVTASCERWDTALKAVREARNDAP